MWGIGNGERAGFRAAVLASGARFEWRLGGASASASPPAQQCCPSSSWRASCVVASRPPSPPPASVFAFTVLVATEKTDMNASGPGAARGTAGIKVPGNLFSVVPMYPLFRRSAVLRFVGAETELRGRGGGRNKGMGPKSMPSKSKLKFSSCDPTGIVPGLERPVAGENALKAADVAEDVEVKVTAAAVESRAADVAAWAAADSVDRRAGNKCGVVGRTGADAGVVGRRGGVGRGQWHMGSGRGVVGRTGSGRGGGGHAGSGCGVSGHMGGSDAGVVGANGERTRGAVGTREWGRGRWAHGGADAGVGCPHGSGRGVVVRTRERTRGAVGTRGREGGGGGHTRSGCGHIGSSSESSSRAFGVARFVALLGARPARLVLSLPLFALLHGAGIRASASTSSATSARWTFLSRMRRAASAAIFDSRYHYERSRANPPSLHRGCGPMSIL
ncbi:hypothetical protein B0H14DRAFT_2659353 [Mycena olivaceomarginata]|nr:hypothetical protein B0H14DRAFT_2659353 [Mycena olivaceomarginata]